ncbi:energy transducer TonB [Thermoflexibacter ruber]|uniref:Protein TonB n=1 Tax=Thermoflexibacter ruber TaxID=1003 RepID=A0A1I2IUU0_9BACT|nr:energy transducer TonB [Thermoflexibacter ruber]SFF46009.1 protein TonB [Thermoflexibacter ruber]
MGKDKYQPKNYDTSEKMRLWVIVVAFLILTGIIYWVLQPPTSSTAIETVIEEPILAVNDKKVTKVDNAEPAPVPSTEEKVETEQKTEAKKEKKPLETKKIEKKEVTKPSINEAEALVLVDEMATPLSGYESYYRYIRNNMKYPSEAIKQGTQGNVTVEFIVDKEGNLHNIRIKKGIGHGCDEEAIRVVKAGEKWKPAKNKGKIVMQKITLPISFRLNDSDKMKN